MNQYDLKVDDIDYKWVDNCNDQLMLKKAIQLLEEDGDYFPDLKKTVKNKLQQLQCKDNVAPVTSQISKEEKNQVLNDLEKWAQNLPNQPVNETQKHEAENLKIKGDEALKSGDFEESINFYQQAIKINPKNELVYGNQAFAYTQLKKYKEGVQSASQAIRLNQKYVKGYYRRVKANEGLKNFINAYQDVLEILKLEPQNTVAQKLKIQYQKNIPEDQLKQLQQESSDQNQQQKSQSNKVKIQIEEQSDESDEEQDDFKQQLLNKKQKCSELIQKGDFDQAIKIFESYVRLKQVQDQYKGIWVASMCNLSHCYKQIQDDDSAVAVCNDVIEYYQNLNERPDQKNINLLVKTIIRKAFSLERKEKLKFALETFLLAQKFAQYNPQINQGIQRNLKTIKNFDDQFDYSKLQKRVNIKLSQFKFCSQKIDLQQQPQSKIQQKQMSQNQNESNKNLDNNLNEKENNQNLDDQNNQSNFSGLELDRLIELKNEGNKNFKSKNFKMAIENYSKALKNFDTANDQNLNQSNQKVLVDLLSNRSLSYYYYQQYQKGIDDAQRILKLTANNFKVLYRMTLNQEGLTNQLYGQATKAIDKKTKLDFYQKSLENAQKTISFAQKILENENNDKLKICQNKANEILQKSQLEIKKLQQKIVQDQQEQNDDKRCIKNQQLQEKEEVTNVNQNQKENVQVTKQQQTKKENGDEIQTKKPKQKLLKDFEEKAQKIAEKGRMSLLQNYKEPSTSSQFETELKSFGDEKKLAFEYIMKTPKELIAKFYQSTQIEANTLLKIFNVINSNLSEKTKDQTKDDKVLRICQILPTCKKFKLTIMMLLKKEKQVIKNVIEKIAQNLSLEDDFQKQLKQLYKIKQLF